MSVCPSCGEENPERFRFCGTCAAPLKAATEPAHEVRKTVTVLFCDVTGSTTLGERLDPESLRRVMERYFEAMRSVLEHHGATVEKFIGDAVMAVFGVPVLHEDDALRAVRAAVEMRDGLEGLNDDLERDFGVRIVSRTGVNTGEVVAGDPTQSQSFASGDAVNVAARLEQSAQPGEILIGAETQRLVRDAVRVESIDPLLLKGKEQPVAAYRLVEVLAGVSGFARRLDSPLVGRERELELLRQSFDRAVEERACYLFTLLGPAGVGKSRLVAEFLGPLGEAATVLSGRCLPYGEGITFWPLVEIAKQAAGVGDGDSPKVATGKITALVEAEEHGAVIAERLAQVLGFSEAASSPEETFWAARRLFEFLAQQRPLVIVLDDIHWGEPTFLDLIDHVGDWSRDAPILLLCMARADLLDMRPDWAGGKLNATSILLDPLTEGEATRLVDNLVGEGELAEAVRSRIVEAAEGNPLFVEETLGMLIDEGALLREDGHWVATDDLSDLSLPPTIQALIASRLDRLELGERKAIERASVVGKAFWRGAVAALSPEDEAGEVGPWLLGLVRKELVRPERSTLPGDDAFRFRHIAIRDAAYDFLPKQERAELHERFADWVEGGLIQEHDEILGYHLEQAYRYRTELGPADERARELARRAAERLAAAAERALHRGDSPGAANLLTRAAALLPKDDQQRVELLPALGVALTDSAEFRAAEGVLEEAVTRAGSESATGARALLARCFLRRQLDPAAWYEDACREAAQAIRVFGPLGDERGLALSWRLLALFHWDRLHVETAEEAFRRAIEHARRAGDRLEERAALITLAIAPAIGPTPAAETLRRLGDIRREAGGDLRVEAAVDEALAHLEAMAGRMDEARALVAKAVAAFEELGLRGRALLVRFRGAALEVLADGDVSEAAREAARCCEELDEMGEKGWLASASAVLAAALAAQGQFEEALAQAERSERVGARGDTMNELWWRLAKTPALAGLGQMDAAEAVGRELVELVADTDADFLKGEALLALARVLVACGGSEEAAALAGRALALHEAKGNVVGAERARRLLPAGLEAKT